MLSKHVIFFSKLSRGLAMKKKKTVQYCSILLVSVRWNMFKLTCKNWRIFKKKRRFVQSLLLLTAGGRKTSYLLHHISLSNILSLMKEQHHYNWKHCHCYRGTSTPKGLFAWIHSELETIVAPLFNSSPSSMISHERLHEVLKKDKTDFIFKVGQKAKSGSRINF